MARTCTALMLAGCLILAWPPLVFAGATEDFVEAQKTAARQLAQENRLAESLALWRTLLPLGSPDKETKQAILQLERDIAARVKNLLSSAGRAYANGRQNEGDDYMLKVLALQPGQPDALARLRKSHSSFAQQQQREKSAEEYRAATGKAASPSAADPMAQLRELDRKRDYAGMLTLAKSSAVANQDAAAPLLRRAHIAMADKAERAGNLDGALAHMESAMSLQPVKNDPLLDRSAMLRGKLSTSWYEQGVRLIKTDLPAAIEALGKSLSFNPYNENAKRKLSQAETLQRNLSRIEGSR